MLPLHKKLCQTNKKRAALPKNSISDGCSTVLLCYDFLRIAKHYKTIEKNCNEEGGGAQGWKGITFNHCTIVYHFSKNSGFFYSITSSSVEGDTRSDCTIVYHHRNLSPSAVCTGTPMHLNAHKWLELQCISAHFPGALHLYIAKRREVFQFTSPMTQNSPEDRILQPKIFYIWLLSLREDVHWAMWASRDADRVEIWKCQWPTQGGKCQRCS